MLWILPRIFRDIGAFCRLNVRKQVLLSRKVVTVMAIYGDIIQVDVPETDGPKKWITVWLNTSGS